ncbi:MULTISPECIES: rRNA maturation RNase YbeY [Hymenobacter]|uniref:Endoribonuclease YbeY n=2 Tax=Hymenobacter TaxID=89966 RepID=A0ABS6X211_9BACT|nr:MULTISPECIES: rRNA maturation RNase YbeY [Hymenobacter]MBO3272833.1 rRNA maturation RNase YbeY [Hymenobacter defluvii]MBW3129848.1 rRNA maturation RNase YbeY [Hymenobacter profundi]QNE41164.1 rRNA maturation RNase YbeY [Hymenobacter sp. NBH84]
MNTAEHDEFLHEEPRHETPGIEFIVEEVDFELADAAELTSWIERIAAVHEHEIVQLTYIFCSDEYLHQVNVEYLDHDTYTDVITFDNSDTSDVIEGDIFISVERIRENAQQLGVTFRDELHRVMIHGVLHLLGYADKDLLSQTAMRKKEDDCLLLRTF